MLNHCIVCLYVRVAWVSRDHLELVSVVNSASDVAQGQLHQLVVNILFLLQSFVHNWAHILVANLIVGANTKILRIINQKCINSFYLVVKRLRSANKQPHRVQKFVF